MTMTISFRAASWGSERTHGPRLRPRPFFWSFSSAKTSFAFFSRSPVRLASDQRAGSGESGARPQVAARKASASMAATLTVTLESLIGGQHDQPPSLPEPTSSIESAGRGAAFRIDFKIEIVPVFSFSEKDSVCARTKNLRRGSGR